MARDIEGKNVFRIVALPLLFVAFSTADGQVAALPPWSVLAGESTAVVVGDVVEGQVEVINPEKKAKAEVMPDGKPTLPNPYLFVIGVRLQRK